MFKKKTLAPAPANLLHPFFRGLVYLEFLPQLCRLRGVRTYLEIGVHFGHLMTKIACEAAVGVDPNFIIDTNVAAGKRRLSLHQTTSDDFFATQDLRALLGADVDLSFLDGLHQYEFLLRDFMNAEAASHPGALIVMHDCMPLTAEMTSRRSDATRRDPSPFDKMWTGDVWKIVPILARHRPDLRITLVDSAPTGLVCVSGLDPASRVLRDGYDAILAEWDAVPNAAEPIGVMYGAHPVISTFAVLDGSDRSLVR